jgi:chemotaxis protein methyltransferase CheR
MSTALMEGLEIFGNIAISADEYECVRQLVYERSGINLGDNRQHLVQARLAKRIRFYKMSCFSEYFHFLETDKSGEINHLIDAICTNTTFFFREPDHFDFLAESLRQKIIDGNLHSQRYTLRVWSAACSSGEEPYTIAMVLNHVLKDFPTIDFKILATDLSQKILDQAMQGQYAAEKLKIVPELYRRSSFQPIAPRNNSEYVIVPELRKKVTFANFNLITPNFPFKHGFDYVFCRNVMIYFDQATKKGLVNRIADHIKPEGYLIVGHSESLNGLKNDLTYVKPTIYFKG